MSDDTLDIDELEDEEAATEPEPDAKAKKNDRGPGFFSRLGQKITAPVSKAKPEQYFNPKGVGILGLVFLIAWLLAVNWAPVRIVLWFWTIDLPKTIAFIGDIALGALLMWLWLRRRERGKAAREGDEGQ